MFMKFYDFGLLIPYKLFARFDGKSLKPAIDAGLPPPLCELKETVSFLGKLSGTLLASLSFLFDCIQLFVIRLNGTVAGIRCSSRVDQEKKSVNKPIAILLGI
jgi:hypothetical protein